jgi:hypothetical protein
LRAEAHYSAMKTLLATFLLASIQFGFTQEQIASVVIGGRTYTNATLRVLDTSTGIIMSGTTGGKIKLADLPEPYRSKYYDEKADKAEQEAKRVAKEKKDKEIAEVVAKLEAKQREAEAEANKPLYESDTIRITKVSGQSRETGGMTIVGVLKNVTTKATLRGLSITFGVFDAEGNKVGTATDYISTLDSGDTWKFEATSYSRGKKCSLESVTCKYGRLF